jgi:hypothetical protein
MGSSTEPMRPSAMAMPTKADTTGLAIENELTVASWPPPLK